MTVPIPNGKVGTYNRIGVASYRTSDSLGQIRRGNTLLHRCFISFPIMGLFVEWLYPLQAISSGSLSGPLIEVLYVLTALLLLVGMFRTKLWISMPAYFVIIVASWIFLFGRDGVLDWLVSYGAIIQEDARIVVNEMSLSAVGPETRTLILMMGWSLLVATVQSLALYRGSIGLFTAATIIYLLCLETFLELDVYSDMVRTALFLVILLGSISLSRLYERSSASNSRNNRRNSIWFVTVCIIATVIVGMAWMGERLSTVKATQQMSVGAAVERLEEWIGVDFNEPNTRTAMTGYGSEEGELGVPLKLTNETVFTAETPIVSYWRGETFGYYDGRRWSEPQAYFNAIDIKGSLNNESVKQNNAKDSVVQLIRFNEPKTGEFPLFAGGLINEVTNISTVSDEQLVYLLQDEIADTLKYPATSRSSPVMSYQLEVAIPWNNTNALRRTSGTDPNSISKRYLQLPKQLPLRVKELGAKLTANTNNRYDAVQAVQTALQNNYKYSLNTNVPPANQDFVDHFLFHTQVGYCNHFSTSMVILLRTQGIPSRMVKGYAPGTVENNSSTSYIVQSSDAHSWVEVYFPQVGWVPFDPTPGFSIDEESSVAPVLAKEEDSITNIFVGFMADPVAWMLNTFVKIKDAVVAAGFLIPGLIIVTILIIASIISVWTSRRHIYLWRIRYISRSTFPQREQLLQAALLIWEQVGRQFGPIPKGATIREYVHSLTIRDENLREELIQFVEQWESIAYDETSHNRVQSISFLQRCTLLAHSLS